MGGTAGASIMPGVFWKCATCGALIPATQFQCPHCAQQPAQPVPPLPSQSASAPVPQPADAPKGAVQAARVNGVPWARAISLPAALVGILAFFLQWIQVSCGPIRFSLSGYEIASGQGEEKLDPSGAKSFWQEMGRPSDRASRRTQPREKATERPDSRQAEPTRVPALYIVPAACLVLALLALFGLPRAPTVLVSALAMAYLAYFTVTTENQASDPRTTGGLLQTTWLAGYWLSWVGLAGPLFGALVRPRDR